jgi:hypothetical protein
MFIRVALAALVLAVAPLAGSRAATPGPAAAGDTEIADSLAAMLRAGRTVISENQARINDPSIGAKGLEGKTVLAQTIAKYRAATGSDPLAIDPTSRQGNLLRDQMDAIVAVMDNAQPTLNALGVGFKGFIPAIFARLVNEEFARRAGGRAEMKVTAPPDLVRNRSARPDSFELQVITTKFLTPSWPRGMAYSAMVQHAGRSEFRVMVPEYYATSCLACHGDPKGSLDVTGYPREGRHEGDLGGVISITLSH